MIRLATIHDYITIVRSIQNLHITYISPSHIKKDIKNKELYVIENNNKIIAFATLVYCPQYNNYAIKRMCIPNKKNRGKGYSFELLKYLTTNYTNTLPLICTPWQNNFAMRHMLEKLGFELNKIFNTNWCLYIK